MDSFLRQRSATKPKRSLLPARRLMSCDQRVFRLAKGASSADYCSKHNVLVTGSADRLVRVWNPFVTTFVTVILVCYQSDLLIHNIQLVFVFVVCGSIIHHCKSVRCVFFYTMDTLLIAILYTRTHTRTLTHIIHLHAQEAYWDVGGTHGPCVLCAG